MLKNAETKEQMDATSNLLNDAPLLLAEVLRLREGIRKALIPTDTSPWTHPHVKLGDLIDVLKEMIE